METWLRVLGIFGEQLKTCNLGLRVLFPNWITYTHHSLASCTPRRKQQLQLIIGEPHATHTNKTNHDHIAPPLFASSLTNFFAITQYCKSLPN